MRGDRRPTVRHYYAVTPAAIRRLEGDRDGVTATHDPRIPAGSPCAGCGHPVGHALHLRTIRNHAPVERRRAAA
jgi:hypothetical protein